MAYKFVPYSPPGAGGGNIIDVDALPTENIDQDKIYRTTERVDPVLWASAVVHGSTVSMSVVDFYQFMTGASIQVETRVVETLPNTMDASSEATLTAVCYIVESTGIAYISESGASADAVSIGTWIGGADGGWVNSSDEIVPSETMTVYAIRGKSSTIYGIPDEANNKAVFEHTSEGGWVDYAAVLAESEAQVGQILDIINGEVVGEDTGDK